MSSCVDEVGFSRDETFEAGDDIVEKLKVCMWATRRERI
jgi:hypothetical protein